MTSRIIPPKTSVFGPALDASTPPSRILQALWTQPQLHPLLIALTCMVVCGLIGVGALLGRAWLLRIPPPILRDPHGVAALAPPSASFALLTIAGYPSQQVVGQALAQEVGGDALPTLLAASELDERTLTEALLQIAAASEAHAPTQAAAIYQLAADMARLGPTLDDSQRLQVLIKAGTRLWALGWRDADTALAEWEQAIILLQSSSSLTPVARATAATTLAHTLERVGDPARAAMVRALALQETRPGERLPPPLPLTTHAPPAFHESLQQAMAARQEAALLNAQALMAAQPVDYARLYQALAQESTERRNWATTQLAARLPLAQQAAVLEAHIKWLLLEQFVAQGYLPRDVFGDWEARRASIQAELGTAWQQLDQVRAQQLMTLPTQEEALSARRDWLTKRLIAIRLGRDLGTDPAQLWADLGSITGTLAETGPHLVWRGVGIVGRPWRIPNP